MIISKLRVQWLYWTLDLSRWTLVKSLERRVKNSRTRAYRANQSVMEALPLANLLGLPKLRCAASIISKKKISPNTKKPQISSGLFILTLLRNIVKLFRATASSSCSKPRLASRRHIPRKSSWWLVHLNGHPNYLGGGS